VSFSVIEIDIKSIGILRYKLIEVGLTYKFAKQTAPFSRYLTLTYKGKKASEYVEELEKVLSE